MQYHVQLKRVEFVQVEIESDDLLTLSEIQVKATEKALREFGCADETEVIHVERSPLLIIRAAQPCVEPTGLAATPDKRASNSSASGSR